MWIPGYRVVRTLGEGGMATVYLAIQENFQREVALKIMSPVLAHGDSSYGERFLREARIVAQLNHPHIVAVYDVGVHEGKHYLAMEYVPGTDLKAGRLQLSLSQALSAVKQVAFALDYAHKKGYVHRDIKPENVLLNEDGSRAVLTDFGIARPAGVESGLTQTGTAIGTPSYMSPEQALGKPLDHRTDLYSLGVVLYFLVIGEVPFTADSAVAVGIKHAVEPVPRLPTPLQTFQPIIDKALAKSPDKRFQSGAEFAAALDTLIASLKPHLESAWRAQLKLNSAVAAPGPAAATIVSDAIPAAAPALSTASPAPAPMPAPARSAAPIDATIIASRDDRPGGQFSHRAGSKPAQQNETAPSKLPLVLAIATVLAAGGGGWYWYQQQQQTADAVSVAQPAAANPETVSSEAPITATPPTNDASTITEPASAQVPASDSTPATEPSSSASGEPIASTIEPETAVPTPATTVADASKIDNGKTGSSVTEAAETTAVSAPVVDPKLEQISKLLADADKRLKAGKLIEPANDNAEALYSQVLKLDSQNAAAKDGRKNVGAALAKQGIDLAKAGDTLRATMLYERAVVLAPKARDVQLLKQRLDSVRRAEQAKPLLDKAKQYLTANALITPTNGNAYDAYKQAQAIDPASTLALQGLSEIEVKLADEIERLWRKGQVGDASALYAGAKERYPDSKDIADAGKKTVLSATRKPKPSEQLDEELQRPEILTLRASGNPLNSIPADQPTILVIGTSLHAAFTYQNFKPGATVIEAQLYDDSHQIKLGSKKLSLNYDAGELRFQIDRPVEGYPDGEYFLDLYAAGERLVSLPFKIQRADLF